MEFTCECVWSGGVLEVNGRGEACVIHEVYLWLEEDWNGLSLPV